MKPRSLRRHAPTIALVAIGLSAITAGIWLETRNPRSNTEDSIAWAVLLGGGFLTGVGLMLPLGRAIRSPLGRTAVVILGGMGCAVGLYEVLVILIWSAIRVEVDKSRQYSAALNAARPSAPYVSDFVRMFPSAKVRKSYFTAGPEPGFDVSVILHGRYELTMKLPVNFDSSGEKVVGYGEPAFYLNEAERVEGRTITYDSSGARQFGSAEWRRIVASNGDFEAIGYKMIKDQPVPGLEALMSGGK
jgi:hypothetical protein